MVGNYPFSSLAFTASISQFADYLSYDIEANQISYKPKINDGYELRKYAGASSIEIKLIDTQGYETSYEMNFTFVVPLLFIEDLPDMVAITGETASVELPEVAVETGYEID